MTETGRVSATKASMANRRLAGNLLFYRMDGSGVETLDGSSDDLSACVRGNVKRRVENVAARQATAGRGA